MRFRIIEALSIVLILSISLLSLNGGNCSAQGDVEIGDTVSFDFNIDFTESVNAGSIEITILDDSLEIVDGIWAVEGTLIAHFDKSTGRGVFLLNAERDLDPGKIFTVECKVVSAGDCGIVADIVFKDDSETPVSVQEELVFDNPVPDVPMVPVPSEPGSSETIDPGTEDGGSVPSEVVPENPSSDDDSSDAVDGTDDPNVGSVDDTDDVQDHKRESVLPIVIAVILIGFIAVFLVHRSVG